MALSPQKFCPNLCLPYNGGWPIFSRALFLFSCFGRSWLRSAQLSRRRNCAVKSRMPQRDAMDWVRRTLWWIKVCDWPSMNCRLGRSFGDFSEDPKLRVVVIGSPSMNDLWNVTLDGWPHQSYSDSFTGIILIKSKLVKRFMDIPSFVIRKLTHKWYVERDARRVAKSAAKESRSFGGFGGFAPKLRNSETPPSETFRANEKQCSEVE